MGAGARVYGGVVVWILAMLTVLSAVDIGDIRPIEHTMFFDRVAHCAQPDCGDPVPLDLPFSTPARYTPGIEHQFLQFTVPLNEVPTQMQAFFIPKYNHHLRISVNGALVHAQPQQRHPWMGRISLCSQHPKDGHVCVRLEVRHEHECWRLSSSSICKHSSHLQILMVENLCHGWVLKHWQRRNSTTGV